MVLGPGAARSISTLALEKFWTRREVPEALDTV